MSEENQIDPTKAQAAFTEEQKKELGAMMSAAFKGEGKRQAAAAVTDALKAINWSETLKLEEVLEAKLAKFGEKPADPSPGNQPAKPDPKIAALEAKVAELTTTLQNEAKAREEAVQASRNKDALAALKATLGPHVRPEGLEMAAALLFEAQKRVTLDDNGNVLFKTRKAPYAGAAEEDVQMPLADGVQQWLKSDEGKFFVPAPGTQQLSGRQAPPGPRSGINRGADGLPTYDKPATTDAEKIRRAEEQAQVLAAKFPHLANL